MDAIHASPIQKEIGSEKFWNLQVVSSLHLSGSKTKVWTNAFIILLSQKNSYANPDSDASHWQTSLAASKAKSSTPSEWSLGGNFSKRWRLGHSGLWMTMTLWCFVWILGWLCCTEIWLGPERWMLFPLKKKSPLVSGKKELFSLEFGVPGVPSPTRMVWVVEENWHMP